MGRFAWHWSGQLIRSIAQPNEKKAVLTDNEARKILYDLHDHHNPQYGIKWEDLTALILDSGLGRDINRRELQRFVHHEQLAIQKPRI
jgi:hypothetical protein